MFIIMHNQSEALKIQMRQLLAFWQKVDKSDKKQSLSPYLHTLCSNTFFIFDNSTVPNRQINGA